MVFNSATVMAVADVSTDTWQLIWRIPASERINTNQLLEMAFCLPMHQLGRFVLCLWSFMCLPSSDSFYSYDYESLSASSSDVDDDDRLAFDHNLYNHHRDYNDYSDDDDDDRSDSSFDDYYDDHYSNSD